MIEERKDYSAAQRKELAKKGLALPDGSYPIVTIQDLKNAIQAFGRAKNQAEVKAHIIKRARALGATSLLPDSWKQNTLTDAISEWRSDLAARGLAGWTLGDVEVRGMDGGTGDGSYTLHGHAAVFNTPTVLHENKRVRISEEIMPGAFDDALGRSDLLVHLNHGHDMATAVASTSVPAGQIGGLELRQDALGLAYFARVDSDDPDAKALAVKMRRGVIRGASFKFQIGGEDRTETELEDGRMAVHYRINQVSRLSDVCVCAQGAYSAATSTLRSFADLAMLLDRRSDDESLGDAGRTPSVGSSDAAPSDEVGVGGRDLLAQVALMRARMRVAATTLR